ncbi:hypothetical protein [Capillimicrobium parvum]|nr:hypothetical protein [Capillimicrobium parvum]
MTAVLAAAVAATLAVLAVPARSDAKYRVAVGLGDQQTMTLTQPLFIATQIKRLRYFIPYNAIHSRSRMQAVEDYVRTASSRGMSVMIHISTNDLRIRRGRLPSARGYRRDVGRLVRRLRPMGVREWGVWNEANHASQPTWNHPKRAAAYYRQMRRICRGCRIVALDVLDQRGVDRYISRFYQALPRNLRRSARFVGIHNYSDVNRRRTTGTRLIMRSVRRYVRSPHFWLTETGGVVELGRSFRCSERRAANRLKYLFRILKAYRHSIDRAYVYNWFGTDCRTRMDTGLVNKDGSARRGYRTLRVGLRSFTR